MIQTLFNKVNYTKNINYIISNLIFEYDIRKANISILKLYGKISEEFYNQLLESEKDYRERTIGCMIRDNPDIGKILANGIIEAKKDFMEINNLEDSDILAIKNDALFVLNKKAINNTTPKGIYFAEKNLYTSFYKLGRYEIYFRSMPNESDIILDIKGIKDTELETHQEYFLDFLCNVFSMAQKFTADNVLRYLHEFYIQYTSKLLPIGYYRRFDSQGEFDVIRMSKYNSHRLLEASEDQKPYIDISHNLNFILELIKIFSEIYTSQNIKK